MTLPTGTITFLFTDIVGSTKLWESYPEQMTAALVRHDELMRIAIDRADGYLVKSTGDGTFAAFHTATDALNAALTAQIAMQREPWPAPVSLHLRMGLHTGAVALRDGDYFGVVLSRAARLMAAGHGDQILLSEATQELSRDSLPVDVGLRALGEHRLKDLTRPENVFQLTHPNLPEAFPPLRSLNNVPNNLPRQLTSLIGRETELGELTTLLHKNGLLTLTGSGGSGKTRLSLHVAADAHDDYPDGVWLVELAPLSDPGLVVQTVATVLGVAEQVGRATLQSLTDNLKNKRLLLILDNCEHLLSACAQLVAAVLRSCPGITVLASSREALGIAGERTYRVPSLSLPQPKDVQTATVEKLNQYAAVRLFIERAQYTKPDFHVTNETAPVLAQLCYRLDGIPLAIELAAARTRSLSLEEINQRLDSRFRLLTGGDRSALPRQQTLRALVDWSYDLLNDSEKTLLARLSVFAGGWTLDAAEAVCGFEPLEDWEILDHLTSLADKSIVLAEDAEGGATRYRMLETLRQYAIEKLAASPDGPALQGRHRDWYLALAERAEFHLRGPEQGVYLSLLEVEHDNLRAAVSFCAHDGETDGGEAGLRLTGALCWFWYIRGYLNEGREHLARALHRAEEQGGASNRGIAKALYAAGFLAYYQSHYNAAKPLLERSLGIWQTIGDRAWTAETLGMLGFLAYFQGDNDHSRRWQEESLAIREQLGDKRGIAASLNALGNVTLSLGDLIGARSLFERSLVLRREIGDRRAIADSLNNLSVVATRLGEYDIAEPLQWESLAIHRSLGNKSGYAISTGNLGDLAFLKGDYCTARRLMLECLGYMCELGDRHSVAYNLEGLANMALSVSQPERVVILRAAATVLRDDVGAPRFDDEVEQHEEHLATARELLGNAAFEAAWAEGAGLTWQQAAEYAATEDEPPPLPAGGSDSGLRAVAESRES